MKRVVRVGTRGSSLALVQTEMAAERLKQKYPEWTIETVIFSTRGDKILDRPLSAIGGKGLFVSELEEALAEGRIDLAVHSAKDMPAELAECLTIAAALPRADARDVLVTRKGVADSLVIGTASPRRQFQLKAIYPQMRSVMVRGNVPTRLQKVREGECDGVVLAFAGLERLGLLEEEDLDYRYFSPEEMVPAGGQGIIALESRMDDELTGLIRSIADEKAMLELETERKVLQLLEAGCHEAIGVFSQVEGEEIAIEIIREVQGKVYRRKGKAEVTQRLVLAKRLADSLTGG